MVMPSGLLMWQDPFFTTRPPSLGSPCPYFGPHIAPIKHCPASSSSLSHWLCHSAVVPTDLNPQAPAPSCLSSLSSKDPASAYLFYVSALGPLCVCHVPTASAWSLPNGWGSYRSLSAAPYLVLPSL